MQEPKICCFTGHRAFSENKEKLFYVLSVLLDNMINEGYTVFRAGGALGFDMLAAEAVIQKKENGRNVRLELMLPCREQDAGWNAVNKARYKNILLNADSVEYISDSYTPECMHVRNRRLVDGSHLCIAYCNRNRGGTAYTCRYAEKNGVHIINLASYLSPNTKFEDLT
jgi:uncharacterized phage-like protein YoqJ